MTEGPQITTTPEYQIRQRATSNQFAKIFSRCEKFFSRKVRVVSISETLTALIALTHRIRCRDTEKSRVRREVQGCCQLSGVLKSDARSS